VRRLESSEEEAAEYGVGDDHGGESDVAEEERNGALAAADDGRATTSTPLQASVVGRHRPRRRTGCPVHHTHRLTDLPQPVSNSICVHRVK